MEAGRLSSLHAYVDDCLEPDERLAFEQQMTQDPALARHAALWRAQNNSIRLAFDNESTGAGAFPISIARHQNETFARAARSGAAVARASREQPPGATSSAAAPIRRSSAKRTPEWFRPQLLWRLGLGVLAVCLAFVWAPTMTVVPGERLGEAGVAAFRAFARPGVQPVEFATSDTAKAQAWLTAQLNRPLYLPAAPAALTLTGARIAPYAGSPAGFLIYKSQDREIGLLVQSLDAPAPTVPQLLTADGGHAAVWTWQSQGFALVGELDSPSLLKIATEFADRQAEAAQPIPERGW